MWSDSTIEATSGWSLPVTHSLTVRNEGERVVIPQGTMRVTRLFGREVAVEEINPGGLRVLSGQTRTFTTQWGTVQNDSFSPWTIGIFDVEVTVQPWGEGDAFHARQRIVVFPWKGAIILLVVVLIAWMHRFSRGPT